ncbi:unnamed protein product [Linum tenue]|uniref:Uncharacterized protein n=1 Tax=Linum tenue TaxID=586396 RepID=A0AAV0MB99_9ROSI|nr:unnamed protein product [Linum tenue]
MLPCHLTPPQTNYISSYKYNKQFHVPWYIETNSTQEPCILAKKKISNFSTLALVFLPRYRSLNFLLSIDS